MKLIKTNIPFTMIANEVLKSKTLSWKAKGLYAYLFSKPDEWDFSSNRIVIESADGRTAITSALRELEDTGYLIRNKRPDGKMDYVLKHSTLSQETELRLEKPKSGFPSVGKPLSGETRPISNIVLDTNTEEESNKEEDTPAQISKNFFSKGKYYLEYLQLFSEKAPKEAVEKEFEKFILYWTEPNGSGTKQRWQQQPTFDVKRRLVTWLGKISSFSKPEDKKAKIAFI